MSSEEYALRSQLAVKISMEQGSLFGKRRTWRQLTVEFES